MESDTLPTLEEIRREFLAETREMLDSLHENLRQLREARNEDWRYPLDRIRRTIHSLKGSGGMFGFPEASRVCHDLEDLLEIITERAGAPPEEEQGFISQAVSLLGRMFHPGPEADPRVRSEISSAETLSAELRRYLVSRCPHTEARERHPGHHGPGPPSPEPPRPSRPGR